MSRQDGLPTNRELQVDFTTAARDVFVAAAERTIESKLELIPAYVDKPLDHLELTIWRSNEMVEDAPLAIHSEKLVITPLQESTTHNLSYRAIPGVGHDGNELFRDIDDTTIEYYKDRAKIIGKTTITDDLRFGKVLPPNGVEADWWERRTAEGQRNFHAGTFRERPSKQSLVAAKFFVGEAMDYVQSDDFDKPTRVRQMNYLFGFSSENPQHGMQHQFNLCITPELPINGHESAAFIAYYVDQMTRCADSRQAKLDRMIALGSPKIILDIETEQTARYRAAQLRAEKFL